ncbi:MAG TPA: NAD-dependent epimerase/dehydratase family protein [Methylophilaceae bacterium]|nr:NAD-dependent epimerase/dehydratase family protein [Methylophilaceae bacterium]
MTSRVLIAGCGDLGLGVVSALAHARFDIHGLRRSAQPFPNGMTAIQADVTRPDSLDALRTLRPDILLYCVAADAQTDDSYRMHYVDGLRNVLATLDPAQLRHVFFVSSTRVYGQRADALLGESIPAVPADFGGERLFQAEGLLQGLPCGTTVLRLSGIYGPGRTRMLRLAAEPERWPAENAWSNRIHRDDAAAFTAFLIERVAAGMPVEQLYLVTDDLPVPQQEVLRWIAGQLGVDVTQTPVMPVSGGKRLSNQRLRATGFELAYPDYRAGYGEMLRSGHED